MVRLHHGSKLFNTIMEVIIIKVISTVIYSQLTLEYHRVGSWYNCIYYWHHSHIGSNI